MATICRLVSGLPPLYWPWILLVLTMAYQKATIVRCSALRLPSRIRS